MLKWLHRHLVPGAFRVTIAFKGGASESFTVRQFSVTKSGDDFQKMDWTNCVLPRRRLFKVNLSEVAGVFVQWVLI